MRQRMLATIVAGACAIPGVALAQAMPPAAGPATPAAETDGKSSGQDGASDQPQLEDIVVTAQRRSENLQNVPIAVTALSSARLAATGIVSAGDLGTLTPNLSLPQAAGTLQPHIRGIGTSSTGAGVENPVAIYVDGVYIATGTGSLLTLNSVDRIEVLKGPQGTLFGRNATGGLINVVTKEPTSTPSLSSNITIGNFRTVIADAYLSGGLTNTLTVDLAVRYEHQGEGWGRNLFSGRQINRLDHDFTGRIKFVFAPSDKTKIRLAADFSDRAGSQDAQHPLPGYPLTFNNAFFGGPFPMGGPFDQNKNFEENSRLQAGGVSLLVSHDFGGVALQSITAYRDSSFAFTLDLDDTPATLITADVKTREKQWSQEFQLSSSASGPFKWVAGVYLFRNRATYNPADIDLLGPISPVPGSSSFLIRDEDATLARSIAGYGQASYEFLKGTTLTLGGRYTVETKALSGVETIFLDGAPISATPSPPPNIGVPSKITYRRFNYRVSLDHKFGPDVLGYLSYNTGFKSGGYNLFAPANEPYRLEDIKAVEGGLKMQLFNRRLRFNIAAFRYEYDNIQVAQFVAGTQFIQNGASAEIYGVDFDADLVVSRSLSLNGGFGWVHDRFTSYPNAPFYSGFAGCAAAPGDFCAQSATGNRLGQTPTISYNVGGEYKVDLRDGGEIALNASYSYMSRWYASADNYAFQPGYGLLNASLQWTAPDKRMSLRVWGKNLTDKTYATGIFEANHGVVRSIGAPRTYGVTLGMKF